MLASAALWGYQADRVVSTDSPIRWARIDLVGLPRSADWQWRIYRVGLAGQHRFAPSLHRGDGADLWATLSGWPALRHPLADPHPSARRASARTSSCGHLRSWNGRNSAA